MTTNVTFAVSWGSVSGATSYNLQQTETDTGVIRNKYSGAATSTTLMIGLPGFYQYAAQACNAAGCSAWANAVNTTDAEPPGGPKIIESASGSPP